MENAAVPDAPPDEQAVRRRVADAGQDHVWRFWDALPEDGRRRLLAQLAEVDFEELAALVDEHVTHPRPVELPPDLEPAPFIALPATAEDRRRRDEALRRGEALLAAGQVAAFVVAGGQGTRLGYDGPKGAFEVGPVSKRPLFKIFADAILSARRTCGAPIPWYIMTSRTNDRATRDFFEAHNFFDLPRDDVRFFSQGMMPAVDRQGKLLLASPGDLAWSPDGHGGSIRALARSGMLADMAARGIEHISYFQVDNVLVPPVDPVFLGFHAEAASDMSSKMARKREPREKIGAFCLSRGRLHVIEYSDLPDVLADARAPDGRLRFEAGSIAIHILARRFVERLSAGRRFALPFHRAEKKIACVGADGRTAAPAAPNGVKFETFVFDALPMAEHPVVLEIDRRREFSPVKNADGEDSPATARRDMVALAAERLDEAGACVPRDPDGQPLHPVEISPLAARTLEELKDLVARRRLRHIDGPLYLGPEDV
ncbi:MAG: UDPGP type 1 family protein [Planctomycetes bacterium]|nr:UDPGP type 1 family protein [Planctomycetota bacterium]